MKKTDDAAIEIKNVSKEFVLPQSKNSSIKHAFVSIVKKNNKTIQKVLDDVSFNINKGDFFGIVGRNGSGKSTLLKMLAGVYTPTAGEIKINGSLTPFIELGVGFNPELSGRDNVFLNGALLGFTHEEMASMYDEIVEFAELEPFMDQKLKNYSSGMQVRLAFSVAIKARNEILIFDEVLAVGDEAFQRKCYDVFDEYKALGQTVILVTHDMGAVKNFCNRAVLLDQGKISYEGDPMVVASAYSELNQESTDLVIKQENKKPTKHITKFISLEMLDITNRTTNRYKCEDSARIRVSIDNIEPSDYESIGVTLIKKSGEHIGGINSRTYDNDWKKRGKINLDLKMLVSPGRYRVYVEVFKKPGQAIDYLEGPLFSVTSKTLDWSGLTKLNASWSQGVTDES